MVRRNTNNAEDRSLAETFAGLKSDYQATKTSRFRRTRTVPGMGASADYHYRTEARYLRMMEYARDMDRNDCIVGQTVDRAVTNTIQDGFVLDPNTGDTGLDTAWADRWREWSEDSEQCDIAGERTFAEIEELVPRHCLVDGDILALPNRSGALEMVEGHRLRTPTNTSKNVVGGVLLDSNRRRLQYWLTRNEIDSNRALTKVGDVKQYDARDTAGEKQVFHVYVSKRLSQTRGVTAFAPIFDLLGMFEDINFAKLVQQQVVSCFAVFRKRSEEFLPGADAQRGERSSETLSDGTTRTIEGVAPGMEIFGQPGEDLIGFSPNVPNPEFFPHVKLILTLIGVNLGMPLVLVMMDASQTNFSGWRGAVDQARLGFRRNQRRLALRFHSPVFRWKVRQWLAEDAAARTTAGQSNVNPFGHRWHPPTWPYIEPLKDATADLVRVRNCLISPRRLHSERGREWADIARETVEDNAMAIRRAREEATAINAEFSDQQPVHWRELLSLPTPDGVKIQLTTAQEGQDVDAA